MNGVFLDTVGLLAVWDQSDQWHSAAARAYQVLIDKRDVVMTSTYVLLECGNAAARRPYRKAVDDFRATLESSQLLIAPTEEDWRTAWNSFAAGHAGQAGIVDHISFSIMRRLGLTHAFTNDSHFSVAGIRVLF